VGDHDLLACVEDELRCLCRLAHCFDRVH
jgi:hypothetical protein